MRLNRTFPVIALLALLCAAAAADSVHSDPLADARALLNANRVTEAESAIRQYLAANQDSADAHFLLGYVLFREQKAKESLAEFTAGAQYRHPQAAEFKVIASDYVMLGGLSDADKWFSEVVKETPGDSESWYLLGRTKYTESSFADAIADFQHALSLHPKYVEAENNIGLSWLELGDKAKAKEAFETAIQWEGDPPTDAQPFLNLGTLFCDAGQYDQAVGLLSKALSLSPKNPTVHEQLARAYSASNKLPQAESELKIAISLAPSVSPLHFQLAQIYRKEGMADRAQQEFAICKQLSSARSSEKTPNPFALSAPDSKP